MMKGLLLKDIYIFFNQSKFFCLLMVILAVLPRPFTHEFAIVYGAMIPMTAIAFDDSSKWNQLADMMPYKVRDLVSSKYIVGLLSSFAMLLVSVVSQIAYDVFQGTGTEVMMISLKMLIIVWGFSGLLLSLSLPFLFKMGAERGRLLYIVATVICIVGLMSVVDDNKPILDMGIDMITVTVMAAAVIGLFFSIALSTTIYRKKRS